MRVVHLSTGGGPLGGGASRAAYRIHRALGDLGAESSLLCLNRSASQANVHSVTETFSGAAKRAVSPFFDRLQIRAFGSSPQTMWSSGLVGLYDVCEHPLVQSADVIALYFVGGGFLSTGAVARLLKLNKPVVWRLSDMWAFTGGCHYALNCDGFRQRCGKCPQLGSDRTLDLSFWTLRQKRQWELSQLTVVTPSHWLSAMAESSAVFGPARKRVIATGVDTQVFRPINKSQAREILGLPIDRKLVLSGGLSETRKGGPLLVELLSQLFHQRDDLDVVALQADTPKGLPPARVHNLGRLNDEVTLALVYAASDAFLAPFEQDNLPNSVLESLACGTPVVGFGIGGVADAVLHERTGLVSRPGETQMLAKNLLRVLDDKALAAQLAAGARAHIEQHFNLKTQAQRYLDLYNELLAQAL